MCMPSIAKAKTASIAFYHYHIRRAHYIEPKFEEQHFC